MMDNYDLWERQDTDGGKYKTCEHCGCKIHYANAAYEQDECIRIEDKYICRDCIESYMLENYRARLEE